MVILQIYWLNQLGENLKETELHYGDDFAVLATHVLLDLHKKSGQGSLFFYLIFLKDVSII